MSLAKLFPSARCLAMIVSYLIHDYPVEPRAKRRFALKTVDGIHETQKDILRYILRVDLWHQTM